MQWSALRIDPEGGVRDARVANPSRAVSREERFGYAYCVRFERRTRYTGSLHRMGSVMPKTRRRAESNERDKECRDLAAGLAVAGPYAFGHADVLLRSLHAAVEQRNVRGLREAKRDCLEACKDMPSGALLRRNAALSVAGLPSVELGQREVLREVGRILRRGRIVDADEFRLIDSILGELIQSGRDPERVAALQAMIAEPTPRVRETE